MESDDLRPQPMEEEEYQEICLVTRYVPGDVFTLKLMTLAKEEVR